MGSNSLRVCRHFALGISFMVVAAASGALGSDRLPPPDKDPSASQAGQVRICHLAQSTHTFNAILVSPSSVTLARHLRHGDCIIDDNIACTSDSCDPLLGCVHTPNDSLCDDGLFCTTEHCEPAVGCVAVSTCPPFTDGCVIRNDSCDESGGTCVDLAVDAACDDGNECTTDTCDLALDCQYAPLSDLASCTGGICCAEACVSCADDCCCADAQCASPDTCGGGGTPNVCGCTPTTCAAEGADCGNIADECGGTLDCGTCAAPDTCGGGGTPNVCGGSFCTITPFTCVPPVIPGSNNNPPGCPCGTNGDCIGDCRCGDPCTAGSCPAGELCQSGVCDPSGTDCSGSCPTGTTCITDPTESNFGSCSGFCPPSPLNFCAGGISIPICIPDNGSNLSADCCPCTSGDDCINSECVNGICNSGCTPTTCADLAPGSCGSVPDGCGGTLECGCTAPETCGGGGTPNVCALCTITPFTCIPPVIPGSNNNPDGCPCNTNGDCVGECRCGDPCTAGSCPAGELCQSGVCDPSGTDCSGSCPAGTTCNTDQTSGNFGSCAGVCPPSSFSFCVDGTSVPICVPDNGGNLSADCCPCTSGDDCINSECVNGICSP